MGLFKCLNFQSFPLYLSKRKASVHFHEQMPCLKAVFTASCFANIINFRWQIVGKSYIHSLNNLLTPLIYRDNFTIVSQ